MGITLYHFPPSAPSRAALLVAHVLQLDVDVQLLDLFKREQLKDDFVQINPQHIVPTLVDGDFVLWESRAIASYLARTYGKEDNDLYPNDVKERAIIDQRLYFDATTFYPRIRSICFPVLFQGEIEVSEDKKAAMDEAFGFLDVFLDGHNFVAGNHLTIADCALAASVSTIQAVGWNLTPYANVSAWIVRCTLAIPKYAEVNQYGADLYGKAVKAKLAPGQI